MESANFKAIAKDIADGYRSLNPHMLKGFVPADYKTLYHELIRVEQGLRSEQIPLEDIAGLRARNMKLQRISNALFLIRAEGRKRNIIL